MFHCLKSFHGSPFLQMKVNSLIKVLKGLWSFFQSHLLATNSLHSSYCGLSVARPPLSGPRASAAFFARENTLHPETHPTLKAPHSLHPSCLFAVSLADSTSFGWPLNVVVPRLDAGHFFFAKYTFSLAPKALNDIYMIITLWNGLYYVHPKFTCWSPDDVSR